MSIRMSQQPLLWLKTLIDCLKPQEQKNCRNFLQAFGGGKGENKAVTLYDSLRKSNAPDSNRLRKKLNQTEASFKKLLERTRSRVLESLILDINIDGSDTYPTWGKEKIKVNKRSLEAKLLLGRGMDTAYLSLQETNLEKARKYELFEEIPEILLSYRTEKALKEGEKAFEGLEEDLAFYNYCLESIQVAKKWYFRYYVEEVDFKGQHNQKVGLLTEAIADLQERYRKTGSARVGEYMLDLMGAYYEVIGDLSLAYETNLKLVELYEQEPAISGKKKIAEGYNNLADAQLYMCKFDESIINSKKVQDLIPHQQHFNYLISLENQFFGFFYQGESRKALNTIDELLDLQNPSFSFQFSKWSFLKANALFLEGDFKASSQLLSQAHDIDEDKEGWNIGIRLLSILNLFETTKFDLADAHIEALRKHLERIQEDEEIKKRDELILNILRELEKQSFNLPATFEKMKKTFELLESSDPAYRWEIQTPEMIVFQDWFQARMNDQSYRFQLPQAAIDRADHKPTSMASFKLPQEV